MVFFKQKYSTFIRFLPYGNDSAVSEDWAFVVNNSVLTYSKDSKDENGILSFVCDSNS